MNDLALNVKAKLRYRGWYRAYTTDPEGNITKDTGFFPNLITNIGLDYIGTCPNYNVSYSIQDFTNTCVVGTGNTTPAYTDTTLQAGIALVSNLGGGGCGSNTSYNAGPPAYWQGQRSFTFAAGTATGNIAELGVGPSINGATGATQLLFSRALVVDGGGSPTVIPVLATEALTVTYVLQVYIDLTDHSYTMSLSGTSYSGIWRMANVGTVPLLGIVMGGGPAGTQENFCLVYNGTIGVVTAAPTGTKYLGNATEGSYTSGSYFASFSCPFTINQGNLSGGITAIMWQISQGGGSFQMSVSPAIPKTSTYNMTLNCNVSWARY